MQYSFSISEIKFDIQTFQKIKILDSFQPFTDSTATDMWQYVYKIESDISIPNTKCLYRSLEYDDYQINDKLIQRFFKDRDSGEVYASAQLDVDEKKGYVFCKSGYEHFFTESGNTLFHSKWEKVLIHENRLLMHSSCVDTQFNGILFSGPSGIGKSTQSDLWCEYENAEVINGDRPIVCKVEDEWRAYGSPYAGSSKVHKNKYCKVRAIVMLQQSQDDTNKIRRLGLAEAFQKVYPMMVAYTWDKDFVQRVCDLTMELISEIPVYEMTCTPDKRAVDLLKSELEVL